MTGTDSRPTKASAQGPGTRPRASSRADGTWGAAVKIVGRSPQQAAETALLQLVVLFVVVALVSGCGGGDGSEGSAFAREYSRLHAATDSGTLFATAASDEEIATAIRSALGEPLPILLPGYLPTGFGLAAPFRGTGSGSPLPNPHVWADGYAITYTDGSARITLVVGEGGELGPGAGEESSATFQGLPLFVWEDGGLVQVSTGPEAGTPLVAVGERVEPAELLRVVVGLRPEDAPEE